MSLPRYDDPEATGSVTGVPEQQDGQKKDQEIKPSSPSESLIGHESSSKTDSDTFLTPPQSASSEASSCSSTPATPDLDLIFLSEEGKEAFQNTCLDQFYIKLKEIDPYRDQ